MGAECIEVTHKSTREQLHKWYPGFVDKQAYENGHGGYSGSFAEKRSVEVVPVPEAPTVLGPGGSRGACNGP